MKIIVYSKNGIAFADHMAESFALEFLQSDDLDRIEVSTENFITAVRVLIHDGEIPHDQVEFHFNEYILCPDKHGRLPDWPVGFCDYTDNWLTRLLGRPGWMQT